MNEKCWIFPTSRVKEKKKNTVKRQFEMVLYDEIKSEKKIHRDKRRFSEQGKGKKVKSSLRMRQVPQIP